MTEPDGSIDQIIDDEIPDDLTLSQRPQVREVVAPTIEIGDPR